MLLNAAASAVVSVAAIGSLISCKTTSDPSFMAPELKPKSIEYLTTEMARGLMQVYPPVGQTVVVAKGSPFADSLDYKLRAHGYRVTRNTEGKGVKLTYQIDQLDPKMYYAVLRVGNKHQISRAYKVTTKDGDLAPRTPISFLN